MPLRLKRAPKWLNDKAKGELAEIVFLLKVSALGLVASKPYGDNQPFDFSVFSRRLGSLRVQVRSGWTARVCFRVKPYRSGRGPGDGYDLLVVYVPLFDAWYVIPAKVLKNCTAAYLYPHRPSRGRFEKYRNAWHLLSGDPADDKRWLGLTIHAAAEE
ncbi:MAG: hypothetical protein LAN37_14215 [Acidobacteriia bacterium]|nr:hypothetical protein [Terriglobia bacterium]